MKRYFLLILLCSIGLTTTAQVVNLPAGNYSNLAPYVPGKVPRANFQAPAATLVSGTAPSPTTTICGSPFNGSLDYTFDHYRLTAPPALSSDSDPCNLSSCDVSANTWYMGSWISSSFNYYTMSAFGQSLQTTNGAAGTYTLNRSTRRYRQDCDDRFHLINPTQGSVNYTVVVRPWISVNGGNPIYVCAGDAVDIATYSNYADLKIQVGGVDQGNAVFNSAIYGVGTHNIFGWRNFDQGRGNEPVTVIVVQNTTPATASATSTVCTGSSITLTATGAGAGENYRWYDAPTGGTLLGTGASINVTATLPAGLKTFYVEKYNTNLACPASTRRATNAVQVNTIPVINNHPPSGTQCINGTLSLTVNNTGTPTPSYQWKFYGANIAGATSATYTKTNFQAANEGQYTVEISNSCGSVTSNIALITAVDVATITNQPENRTACTGTNTTITGLATIGTATGYQWQKFNGSTWTNVTNGAKYTGATSSVLGLTGLVAGDAGAYRVVVSGPCNTTNSSGAILTVNETLITTQPPNSGVCLGGTIQVPVVPGGTGPFGYQWQKKNGAIYNNVSGQTSDKLTIIGATAGDGGTYRVVITGSCGTINSADMVLTINPIPGPPTAPNVARCGNGSLSSTATSASPSPTFRWFANFSDVTPVFTGATYTVANLTVTTTYYVAAVSSGCEGPKTAVTFTHYTTRPVDLGGPLTLCVAQSPHDLSLDIVDAVAVGNNFSWTAGAANFNTTIFDPAVVGEGTYVLTYPLPSAAVNTPNCLTPVTKTVTVITGAGTGGIVFDPAVVSGGDNLNLCVGDDPVILNPIPSASGGSWTQITGTGLSFNSTNAIYTPSQATFTASTPNVLRYTVNVGGCTAIKDLNVFVKDNQNKPVVSGIPTAVCPGTNLTLLASVAAPGTWTYDWRRPGGPTLGATAAFSFAVTGTETLEARSINTFGCRSEAQLVNISTPFSSGSITTSKGLINTGEFVKFNYDVTAAGNTYEWDFGDDYTSSEQNPTHYYFAPGVYTVFLTITSNLGCSQVVKYESVTVNGQPIEIITGVNADQPVSLKPEAIKIVNYPNPVTDVVRLESNVSIDAVEVRNAIGLSMLKSRFSDNPKIVTVDMSTMEQGMYLIGVNTSGTTKYIRVIKK